MKTPKNAFFRRVALVAVFFAAALCAGAWPLTLTGTIYQDDVWEWNEETEEWVWVGYSWTTDWHTVPNLLRGVLSVTGGASGSTPGAKVDPVVGSYFKYAFQYFNTTGTGAWSARILPQNTPWTYENRDFLVSGDSWSGSYSITVNFAEPQAPVASFTTSPTAGRSPVTAAFNGSASTSPDGSITNYQWDFESDNSFDATGVTTNTTYSIPNGSNRLVLLRVTDVFGNTASANQWVTIHHQNSYALTVQSGTVTSGVALYYAPGSSVSISGSSPGSGSAFVNWVRISGAGTFGNVNSASTTFAGTADSVVRADYTPSTPASLNSSGQTANSVILNWAASADDAGVTAYDIYRTSGANTVLAATVSGGTTTFTNSPVTPASSFSYHVIARDGTGNSSAASNTVNVSTPALAVPTSLAVTGQTATTVSLSWTAVSDPAVIGYSIYRTRNGGTVLVGTTSGSTATFTDTHVLPATTYAFTVKSRETGGNVSNASNSVNATTLALADADGDGVPDAFESLFGTTANANPSGDTNLNSKVHRPNP